MKRTLFLGFVALALGLPTTAAAQSGTTTYTYTGNPFNMFNNSCNPPGACPVGARITASLTFPTPLQSTFGSVVQVQPLSCTISDGVNTEPCIAPRLGINSAGVITAWGIQGSVYHVVGAEVFNPELSTGMSGTPPSYDQSTTLQNNSNTCSVFLSCFSVGFVKDNPGVWTKSTPNLTISTTSLPPISAGRAYTATLQATGGTPPYAWSVSGRSGLLPYGFFPENVTFNNATISTDATRVTAGIYRLTFSVTDTVGTTALVDLDLEVSCNDLDLDNLNAQYVLDRVVDITGRLKAPVCQDFTKTAGGPTFTFDKFIVGSGSSWALIRDPEVVPATSGYGLEKWVAAYKMNPPPSGYTDRVITDGGGYRSPDRNLAGTSPARRTSRHMWGDAIDLATNSRTWAEWLKLSAAAQQSSNRVETQALICNTAPNACGSDGTHKIPLHEHVEWEMYPGPYHR